MMNLTRTTNTIMATNKDKGMKKSGRFLDLLLNNWWLRHLLFWVFTINYYALGVGMTQTAFTINNIKLSYLTQLKYLPGFFLVVYPMLYYLIPRYLEKRKFFLFTVGFLLLIFVVGGTYANLLKLNLASVGNYAGFDLTKGGKNMLPFIHIAGIAMAIKFIKKAYLHESRALHASHQKSIAELELLKAQIHPHFLFNTLNNLFAHTLRNSADAPQIVVKLSDLLRFMIYESREEFIPLADEIQLLKNYIDLEKLRYGEELTYSLTISGNPDKKWIRPLLLIPLLENSFKHGMSQLLDEKWITLDIQIHEDRLLFNLANSKNTEYPISKNNGNAGGIGLENVKRRLELLYPGEYSLNINNEEKQFRVTLGLPLMSKVTAQAVA
jgi:sensor histidine kinase YesM